MKKLTRKELKEIIDSYINGNKKDFRESISNISAMDLVDLIDIWNVSYNEEISVILATLQIAFEIISNNTN